MVDVWSQYDSATHVTLKALAELCDTSIDRVLETLDAKDIHPSGALNTKAAANYLYERSTVVLAVRDLRLHYGKGKRAVTTGAGSKALVYDRSRYAIRAELTGFFPAEWELTDYHVIGLLTAFGVGVAATAPNAGSRGHGVHLYSRAELEWIAGVVTQARARKGVPVGI